MPPASPILLRDIQAQVGGTIVGDPATPILAVNALKMAGPGDLVFAEDDKYAPQVRQNRAAAYIISPNFPPIDGCTVLRVDNPRLAFLKIMYLFQSRPPMDGGIHRQAAVAPDAELGEGVTIREFAIVRSRVKIGAGTLIESGAHIAEDVSIGEQCQIGPNVVIMPGTRIGSRVILHGGVVVGADGFGFTWGEGRHLKIPQMGNVIIEDDVELGANVCVDRATFGSTIVGRGTKVDNLVQIAHNDVIGEHVIMSGQVGLSGSVKIGNRAILGGKVGVVDHVTIGEDSRMGGMALVIKDVPPRQTVWGYPAREIQRTKRELAALAFLPELVKRLRQRPRKTARSAKR